MTNVSLMLLNIMFHFVPVFMYQTITQRKTYVYANKWSISLFWACPLIVCINFPFLDGAGLLADMKFIPLIVGTLYGGVPAGIILSAVAAICQYVVKGSGSFELLLLALTTVAIVLLFRSRYAKRDMPGKLVTGLLFSAFTVLSMWAVLYVLSTKVPLNVIGLYFLIQSITLLLVLYMEEFVRENAALRKESVRLEKLTANSSLAVIIAHELRNPLTTVKGFLQLIKRQNPSPQVLYYADTAIQELSEAEKVIRTYLTITTLNQAEKSSVKLLPCVEQAVREVRLPMDQKQIELNIEVPPDLKLYCNADQLQLCIVHLLRNGMNALQHGGKLSISGYRKGKELFVIVEDNGVGMTEEQVDQLGTPTYNTRSSGTGTGLMYCYHFVHSLRGWMRIQSEPGRGTVVTMTLPVHRSRPAQAKSVSL